MRPGLGLILCVLSLLAGCGGGGGGGSTPPPVSNTPPTAPPPPPPPPVIGASGGTVTEVTGASVIVPEGALTTDTTIRVAMDSTGAPAMAADLTTSGSMYVITPHGGEFVEPIEVRIPAPGTALLPTQEFKLAKAQPGGEWVVLEDTVLDDGMLSVQVDSFSFFVPVVVTYILPIAQAEPLRVDATLDCGGLHCARAFGTVNATYTVTGNNGQSPANCINPTLGIFAGRALAYSSSYAPAIIPLIGGSRSVTIEQTEHPGYRFGVGRRCTGSWSSFGFNREKDIRWTRPPDYPGLAVLHAPATLDIVEGLPASLEVVFGGGASRSGDQFNSVTTTNRAVIDWERSDDEGASWRVIARSYENEGNPWPFTAHAPWYYWSVRHAFTGTAADQGALIRTHGCFTPRDPPAAPCVTGAATRLNVLQQSALPAIVDAPRSMLVRTGQTASLSATVSGLPAPTLRWQTRVANSNDAWADVNGVGADTANYTTAPLALSDNGIQYRMVATNSLGIAESVAVTISVSDLDVAATIISQPASLSVMEGSDAVFAVAARGTEALSYEWTFNGVPIANANSTTLRLLAVTDAEAGTYRVTVSNDAGAEISYPATLVVNAAAPPGVPPSIVTQPSPVTVNTGNTATFAVGLDGSGPFTFVWRKDGIAIPGATSAVLTLGTVAASDAGSYSVVIGNGINVDLTSAAATLTVLTNGAAVAPAITTQPSTVIIAPGGSGLLAVAASGSGPLSYQWLADGDPIIGATAAVLAFDDANTDDVGNYAVQVTNSLGNVVSDEANVILLGAPTIFGDPQDVSVLENSTTTFRVDASGTALHYQWLLNGSQIPGSNEESYTTPLLTTANSGGVYSALVYNGAGIAISGPAVLTVSAFVAPTVAEHPASVSITAGTEATLCAAFGGTPPFQAQMTRWSGVAWVPVLAARVINDNAQSCTVTPLLQLADNGAQFRFEATSGPGQVFSTTTSAATVTVTASAFLTATTLASLTSTGATANNRSSMPTLSADGRLLAFVTDGTNLVPGFTNASSNNAYVRDVVSGTIVAVNQTPLGAQSIYGVIGLKLAAGGRYAVFTSLAGDLVVGDTNNSQDVFVRDLQTGTTERINVLPNGDQIEGAGNGVSDMQVDISADGRFVSFVYNHDLVGSDPPGLTRLYLRDTQSDQTQLIASSPMYGIAYSALASGGEYLAYAFAIYSPQPHTVMLHDVEANTSTTLFTLDTTNGVDYLSQGLSISGNGRYIAFAVRSQVLLDGSTVPQILVIDGNDPGSIIIASAGEGGVGNGASSYPKLSDDGHVLFATHAPNLSGNLANALRQALVVRTLENFNIEVASRTPVGTGTWAASGVYNSHALSGDGAVLAITASEFDMTGGPPDHQVYVAPRP